MAMQQDATRRKTAQSAVYDELEGTGGGMMTNDPAQVVDEPRSYDTGGGLTAPAGGAPITPPPQTAPPPPAFDPSAQVGHDGSFNGQNREQWRDAWMSSGINSVQGAKEWLAKNGGKWLSDNGTVQTPFGESGDLLFNARGSAAGNGSARPIWLGNGGGSADAPPPPAPPPPIAPPPPVVGGGGGGGAAPPPPNGPMGGVRGSAQDAILKLLADSQKAVDPNDPTIRTQMQARERQGQRASERTRAMLAERAAANGSLSGGQGDGSFESSLNAMEQARGEDLADAEAGLIGEEQIARRTSLVTAIQMAMQDGQFDQAQALQMKLAEMDAALRNRGMDIQRYSIDTNRDLEGRRLDQSQDQFGRSLGQSDSHFNTTMDFNNANAEADNYYRWVMAGMNG